MTRLNYKSNIVEWDVKPQVNKESYYLCSMLFMGIKRSEFFLVRGYPYNLD